MIFSAWKDKLWSSGLPYTLLDGSVRHGRYSRRVSAIAGVVLVTVLVWSLYGYFAVPPRGQDAAMWGIHESRGWIQTDQSVLDLGDAAEERYRLVLGGGENGIVE